jgi:hypothetical protein
MAPLGLARGREKHKRGKHYGRASPQIGLTRASHSVHLFNDTTAEHDAKRPKVHGCVPRCKATSRGCGRQPTSIVRRWWQNCIQDWDELSAVEPNPPRQANCREFEDRIPQDQP